MDNERGQQHQSEQQFGDVTPDTTEVRDRLEFDTFFDSAREPTLDELRPIMARLLKKDGSICYPVAFVWAREHDQLKYTEEQIANGQCDAQDIETARRKWKEENTIHHYFFNIASNYECGGVITDSIVRRDQEGAITHDLDGGKPVLIRGNWRMGKTSMAASLATHTYGEDRTLTWSLDTFSAKTVSEYQDEFAYFIADWIAEHSARPNDREKIFADMKTGQPDPFAHLNTYLAEKGDTVFVALDEVIVLAQSNQDVLHYLASLQQYDRIKLAIVLHRYAEFEQSFQDIFQNFSTHFLRPLTMEEVGALVRQPLQGTCVTVADDVIAEIYAVTGGRPLEVNILCARILFDEKHVKQRHRFTVQRGDVTGAMDLNNWDVRGGWKGVLENYKKIYERSMNSQERAIIDRLRVNDIPDTELNEQIVQPLIDTTFVRHDKQKNVYQINGDIFRAFLNERPS